MVKSVLGVNHRGLQDWLIQRVSAIVMAIYSTGMIAYFLMHAPVDYMNWHLLFGHTWMKVATMLFVASLMLHAWVGMWTIFTDYVKPYGLTVFLNVLVILLLTTCFFWALTILWGV
jgi:succinate dehydrogenase / fumarate reductase membrane anchor subunit